MAVAMFSWRRLLVAEEERLWQYGSSGVWRSQTTETNREDYQLTSQLGFYRCLYFPFLLLYSRVFQVVRISKVEHRLRRYFLHCNTTLCLVIDKVISKTLVIAPLKRQFRNLHPMFLKYLITVWREKHVCLNRTSDHFK
jgi:hypothetical protein